MNNIKFIANCVKNDRFMFALTNVNICYQTSPSQPSEWIYLYDRFVTPLQKSWLKSVFINCDVHSERPDCDWVQAPFSMAPHQYIQGFYKKVKDLRNARRNFKLLFSGNLDIDSYSNQIFKDFFKVLNRIEVIETVTRYLHKNVINQLPNTPDYINKCVILNWTHTSTKQTNIDRRISNEQWLPILARSDFFIATPGILMPLCFNIIEAMSVGTIPLIEFPHQFHPPLRDGVNCISFKGQHQLKDKIDLIMNMSTDKIKALRANVVEYYESYLYPTSIPNLINNSIDTHGTLYLNATQASYDDYLQKTLKG